MTWIKLDDKAPRHPKLAGLSDKAFRWWILALCFASEFLTDGLLPKTFWRQVPKQIRAELSGNSLWDWEDPNFIIHDYLAHQSSREDVEADKKRNRDRALAFRERRLAERRVTRDEPVTATGDERVINALITEPENREQRTDTEYREQRQTVPPARPLISGQNNPRNWGKIHGDHVAGFCDWVCLPDFIFEEFRAKSPGPEYVRGWAAKVRERYEGQTIGEDGLKFWRSRWSESHRTEPVKPKARGVAEILAEREAAKGKAS